ncbi:MAG: glycosyltransferase family 4 protein [Alphaproteobacteria bacterium]
MRILALVSDAFGGRGGIAQFNRDLLTALAESPAVETIVVLPRRIVDPVPALPSAIDWRPAAAGGRFAFVARVAGAFARPWDLVIYGHIRLLRIAALPHARFGRTALVVHGIEAWTGDAGAASRHRIAGLDQVLSVSAFTRDRFLSWSGVDPTRVSVFPCTVDRTRFVPGPASGALATRYGLSGRRIVMTVARLAGQERYKGIDEVMDAMPSLLGRFPDLAYLVVGEGDDRPRLEARARELGIADRVVFAGYVDEAEKAEHYRLADAFVLAGRGEGFGIVLLEAMSCGVPVVASCRDASGEVVAAAGGGIVVDPLDSASLAGGISEALGRRRGEVAHGLANFGPDAFRRRLAAILNSPASGARS